MNNKYIVSTIERNPKSFWRYINLRMKRRSGIDSIQRPDGSTTTSDQEKEIHMLQVFSQIKI